MNTTKSMLKKILSVVIPLAIIALVAIRLKNNKEITDKKVYQYDRERAINVEADTLRFGSVAGELSYSGTFEPNKETKISAEIQGKINEVLVDAGSLVKKGQVLVRLDNSLLKLQLQSLELQVEGLEADVNRYTILANADAIQGVQLEKSLLALKSAKLQKATLAEQINKTAIRAPFNGVVTAKLSEEGGFAAPGAPLIQLTDISSLKFAINVPEHELARFKLDLSYAITADAYSGLPLTGKTALIGSKANMGSSFPVHFSLNNTPDLKIRSGMFGKVHLKSETPENGIIIPASAIIGSDRQPQVYLIRNGRSLLKNVTVSKKIQNNVVVSNGLNEGDVIVTSGFINLFDGANVSVN